MTGSSDDLRRITRETLRDYDARELDANAGDSVRLIEFAGGWWWAENEIGETGWLPERDLHIEPGTS